MAIIVETPNPFQPLTGLKKHSHPGGISIWGWLKTTYPGFVEFQVPTICLVNGQPTLRKDWDNEIQKGDIVNFISMVGYIGWVTAIIIAIILIVAVVLITVLMAPTTPGEGPASDPVFSTKGQTNSIRLGEPIEANYGKNRIYPSMASRPFFQYVDNDQFQHSLFCIGQGEYEIHEIQIGDTDIDSYQEVVYEVIPPGSPTTLFRTNIHTSLEAGGQNLFGPNEPEYVAPGWIGPFANSPTGTETDRIEIDVALNKGLYRMRKNGKLRTFSITFEVQARVIDDLGAPLDDWFGLLNPTITAATTTPQRKTYSVAVGAGRYEVRLRRTSNKDLTTRVGNDIMWEGMRGFITGNEPNFGDVTLLAVKIRATNNLNARTQERFNVIATRKLPIRFTDSSGAIESNGWSAPIATRSVVWAFVDIFRSLYGGRILDDGFFDWDALEVLDTLYESRNEHFDWIFRDAITVWDAARAIARVGRAVPLLVGSLITMRRDGPLEVPVTLFTPDNMIKGTFQWDIKLWEPNDFDSVSVEYTEPETGYKQEQVIATLPGGTTDNPEELRFPGIAERDHAYHEGLYLLASKKYLRENITFETGMEGFIPSFGDLIAISHDVPRWGQSGYILGVDNLPGNDYALHVSEPLLFTESGPYQILLRGSKAEVIGPVDCEPTSDPKVVVITLIDDSDFDWLLSGRTEPMLFLFGVSGQITKYGRAVKIEPQGEERIRITAVNEAAIIHSFDGLSAPPLTFPSLPPEIPELPVIDELFLSQLDDDQFIIQVSWTAAFGALYYVIQSSQDGVNWQPEGVTTRVSFQFQSIPGETFVRVAAVGQGQGPWIQDSIEIGTWILSAGVWDDDGEWIDSRFWVDVVIDE